MDVKLAWAKGNVKIIVINTPSKTLEATKDLQVMQEVQVPSGRRSLSAKMGRNRVNCMLMHQKCTVLNAGEQVLGCSAHVLSTHRELVASAREHRRNVCISEVSAKRKRHVTKGSEHRRNGWLTREYTKRK